MNNAYKIPKFMKLQELTSLYSEQGGEFWFDDDSYDFELLETEQWASDKTKTKWVDLYFHEVYTSTFWHLVARIELDNDTPYGMEKWKVTFPEGALNEIYRKMVGNKPSWGFGKDIK